MSEQAGNERAGKKGKSRAGRGTRRQRQKRIRIVLLLCGVMFALVFFIFIADRILQQDEYTAKRTEEQAEPITLPDGTQVQSDLLPVNKYSRPGIALSQVNGVVLHYTGNPGSTAQANRDYFARLEDSGDRYASSHFVVGLEGEIIECIPLTEISYASNDRNKDTISIECCHPDDTGKFTDATYDAAAELTAWLCRRYGLGTDEVIRHYDVTGKECPLWFVEHEEDWDAFREEVQRKLEGMG